MSRNLVWLTKQCCSLVSRRGYHQITTHLTPQHRNYSIICVVNIAERSSHSNLRGYCNLVRNVNSFSYTAKRTISSVEASKSQGDNPAQGIHENISSLQTRRPLKRKRLTLVEDTQEEEGGKKIGFWNAVAYATAEEYRLEELMKALVKQNLYIPKSPKSLGERSQKALEDMLHVTARYEVGSEPREIFFFREGTVVFWNMPELEHGNVLTFLRQFEENSYDERLVQDESENMTYTKATGKCSHLQDGHMVLGTDSNMELDKYTFSNVMALSVKLGVWEASLTRYVDSIEFVTEDLKRGSKIKMSKEEVLRKTGELFALRHLINLSSDLLDTPDFYWDHEQQEALYQQMCNYFSISRRTRVMNEKLNHCVELMDLLSTHLSDRHHVRLEWMIIILIMVEVAFEIIHYMERFI